MDWNIKLLVCLKSLHISWILKSVKLSVIKSTIYTKIYLVFCCFLHLIVQASEKHLHSYSAQE